MSTFRMTAFYGETPIRTVVFGEDIEAATVNAELAFPDAAMIVVEVPR